MFVNTVEPRYLELDRTKKKLLIEISVIKIHVPKFNCIPVYAISRDAGVQFLHGNIADIKSTAKVVIANFKGLKKKLRYDRNSL